jgi:lipid kinase YegS
MASFRRPEIENIRKNGHAVIKRKVDEPRDATRHAAESVEQDADRVVVIGGDGMLNLVINGIFRKGGDAPCAVGLIPYGTGDDFAQASSIPCGDPIAALEVVNLSPPVSADSGRVNETFFINVATGGFPADAAAETSRTTKDILGKFAYFFTGLANIGDLAAKKFHFTAPRFEWKGAIYAFGLGNGRQVGGGFSVSPKAVVNDGMLDLMIIPEMEEGLVTLISEYSRMTSLDETNRIIYVQASWVDLKSREIVNLNIDGEPAEGKEFRFTVHDRSLPFCLPENSPLLSPPSNGY